MRRRNVRAFGQSPVPQLRKRKQTGDDDRIDAEEIEARLAAYSSVSPTAAAEELRAAFRPPPPEPAPVRETFTSRFTTESLFMTVSEHASEPQPYRTNEEPTVDLVCQPEEAAAMLGVPEDAPWPEVVRAHRRLARLHHPDRHFSSPDDERAEAENTMCELNMAYSVLRQVAAR